MAKQISTICFPPPFNITSTDDTYLAAFIHLLYRVEELTKFIQSNYDSIRSQYRDICYQQVVDLIFAMGLYPTKNLINQLDKIKELSNDVYDIWDYVKHFLKKLNITMADSIDNDSFNDDNFVDTADPRNYFCIKKQKIIYKLMLNKYLPNEYNTHLTLLLEDITDNYLMEIKTLFDNIVNNKVSDMTVKQQAYFTALDGMTRSELRLLLKDCQIQYTRTESQISSLEYSMDATPNGIVDRKYDCFVEHSVIEIIQKSYKYTDKYIFGRIQFMRNGKKSDEKKKVEKVIQLNQRLYDLIGFITHSGNVNTSYHNGHYTTYCLYGAKCDHIHFLNEQVYTGMLSDGEITKWYKFDSKKPSYNIFDPTEILAGTNDTNEVPVLLLYKKRDVYLNGTIEKVPRMLAEYLSLLHTKQGEFNFTYNNLYKQSDVEIFDKLYKYRYIYTKPDNFPLLAKPPVKLLNDNIDVLLSNLSPAHLIHLNKSMLLIKLHRNPVFHQWLQLVDIPILYKFYHNTQNRYYCDKYQFDNQHVSPQFITLCVIPESEQHNINLMCCGVDINKTNLFSIDPSEILSEKNYNGEDIDKSGIIVNGGYFMLPVHVDNKEFGIENPNSEYYPIGNYHSVYRVSEIDGIDGFYRSYYPIQDAPNNFTMAETIAEINPENKQLTLQIVDDTNGILVIDPNNRVEIISIQQFREMKGDYTDRHQYVSGNLLVHNSELVMVEELMIVVYNLIAREGDYPLPFLTKCYVCDMDGNHVRVEQIYGLSIGDPIRITQNGIQIYQSEYRTENLFFPYNVHLFNSQYGNAMNGKIPPGIPVHASDLNPRTCIFKDISNNLFVMHVEGRNKYVGGKGIDLFDLAKLCKKMGAVSAINLDGGSSSKIIWKEQGMPSDYMGLKEYKIGNGIVITPKLKPIYY